MVDVYFENTSNGLKDIKSDGTNELEVKDPSEQLNCDANSKIPKISARNNDSYAENFIKLRKKIRNQDKSYTKKWIATRDVDVLLASSRTELYNMINNATISKDLLIYPPFYNPKKPKR